MARGANKEYEVERILRATVSYKNGRTIHWKYLVKWKGYSDKDNTWEPAESFEASPKLIVKFWKKVDTGGRNSKNAKSFQRGEELSLPDDEPWTDEDAEGEDDEEETEKKEGDESVTPKAGRKKRFSTATETPAKRKRARPSKAGKEAAVAEQDKTSDVDGGVASRRNSRRLSQKRPDKQKNEGRLKRLLDASESEDSSSEDEGASRHTKRKDPAGARKDTIQKPTLKKRKAYIESDEEDVDAPHSDAEGSSHDGSLFSGDDEQEQDGEVKIASIPSVPEPSVEPESTPILKPPQVKNWSEATVNKRHRKQQRVKMIDDPSIMEALEARVGSKIHGRTANTPGQSTNFGSITSPTEEDREHEEHKSSLPTSKNGNRAMRASPDVQKTPLSYMHDPSDSRTRVPGILGSRKDSVVDTTQDLAVTEGLPVDADITNHDEMDSNPDLLLSTDTLVTVIQRSETTEVVSVQPAQSGPPPTAAELLRLSGVQSAPDDLPDFQPDEEDQDANPSSGTGVATTSDQEPTAPNPGQTPSAPASEGAGTWKSSLFNALTPRSIIEKVLASSLSDPPLSPVVPPKLVLQLRLDPISRVPVILKDVVQPPAGPKMIDLVAGEYDGPPGKVFSLNVLQHVQAGGPAARIAADEGCSNEQRSWFSKLLDELEKGSLFIIVTNGHSFAICSSSHHDAARGLGLPSSLVGLSSTAVMQLITITDSTSYASYAIAAEDLKVR